MRKRIISQIANTRATEPPWLDLDRTASIELTSEDDVMPFPSRLRCWVKSTRVGVRRAGYPIRLIFDQPQRLTRISLVEAEVPRTQEFSLKWSPNRGTSFQEIVRQQRNFSSPDATEQTENCTVELWGVTLHDLTIKPDKQNGSARACLLSWRVARSFLASLG